MNEWYDVILNGDDITQGDIIFDCYIPFPNDAFYEALLKDESEVEEPIDVKQGNVVILTQACDLENDKVDSIVTCPVWNLTTFIKKEEHFKSKEARESLRRGREPAYHLLNEYKSEHLDFEFSVVDFHRIYSLPKIFLKKIAGKNVPRIRLRAPYREHLSQAFARYFMRVGLPSDIPKDKIRDYKSM